jgi:pimeloyl-ACP methyl ester carboxylesterase
MLLQIFQRFAALVSLIVLAVGAYFAWSWWDLREAVRAGDIVDHDFNWRLWLGGGLLVWSFLGRLPVLWIFARPGDDRDRLKRQPGETLTTPTTARLHVERDGPSDAPVLIFVHGWGMDASTWWDARRQLAQRYQIVAYDLAGLGRSSGPVDGRYSLERFSDDLASVVESVAPRKAILVGHSIGGMILQTFAGRYPEMASQRVLGLVLENTTHSDPSQTTILGRLLGALRPVLIPLMRLDVVLWPLVWMMNWQSYLSGQTHLAMRFGGFGTKPTRAKLEQVSRLATRNSPSVQAKGNIAMMQWRATEHLDRIETPTLVFVGRDLVTVPLAGEQIASRIRGARLHRMNPAGHMGPLELAKLYNTDIEAFADEIFTRGAAWADRPSPARDHQATQEASRRTPERRAAVPPEH